MMLAAILNCYLLVAGAGCGGEVLAPDAAALTSSTPVAPLNLPATTALTTVAGQLRLAATDSAGHPVDPTHCNWQSSDPTVLSSLGGGQFSGVAVGSTSISVTCGGYSATETAAVANPATPQAIVITHGGTYSGAWSSNDPKTAVVQVRTAEPVLITNSTVTGKAVLILYAGVKGGDLTVTNVTGVGLAPLVAGQPRGGFVSAESVGSLVVEHCTFTGLSFGVYVVASTLKKLSIQQNVASNMDDRKDDGSGGNLPDQRVLGHMVQLNGDVAPVGAEIAWNQIRNTYGKASIEDIINIYESHGSAGAPIHIHDNYLEGAFASSITTWYSGGGIQMDGGSPDPATETGFVLIERNVVVRTANMGISIGTGHDITVTQNRVVSCGKDADGKWNNFAGYAYVLWNYYKVPVFSNNRVSGNSGDLVISTKGQATDSNQYAPADSITGTNQIAANSFDRSCWVDGAPNPAAEQAEWPAWQQRVADAGYVLGDNH